MSTAAAVSTLGDAASFRLSGLSEEQRRAFAEDGFITIVDALTAAEVERLRQILSAELAAKLQVSGVVVDPEHPPYHSNEDIRLPSLFLNI